MLIGVYGDTHLTKNMRTMQDIWEVSATKSIHYMYNKFDEENVEMAVCLGDFFDAPKLEAKYLNFVLPILEEINNKTYPTYILLGNHEADSEDSNILEYLKVYDNIHPVTSAMMLEDMYFLPYHEDLSSIEIPNDKIIFTHHDIYGSSLASGKTKAFFGINPDIFKETRLVLNGHVHLKSKVMKNVVNAGSLLISQQGELRLGDYPSYYIVDTRSGDYQVLDNKYSMIYLTIDQAELPQITDIGYNQACTVLKVEYDGEIPDISFNESIHINWRKKISSIESEKSDIVKTSNFDMKNYLTNYIMKDTTISDIHRDDYITTGLELLS